MLGDPLPYSLRQHVQEFVVVLAGATALPGGLGRHHLTQHSRTSVLVAGISKFEIRN